VRKRIVFVAVSVVLFFAFFILSMLRGPLMAPDVPLVRGVPVFSYHTVQVNGAPLLIERVYVLRVPYKDAVKEMARQLDGLSWSRYYSLAGASFLFKKNDGESVTIKRSLRVPGMWDPKGRRVIADPGEIVVQHPDPDPRGWIVVTTDRPMTGLAPLIAGLRFRMGIPIQGGPNHHTDLSPMLAKPMQHSLNVPDVEVDRCIVTWDEN